MIEENVIIGIRYYYFRKKDLRWGKGYEWFLLNLAFSFTVVLKLYGNSEHVARMKQNSYFEEEKNPIRDCSRTNQMPWTDQITVIAPYLRTLFQSF